MNFRNGKKRANLRDVAREARVSVATVSRVLNSPDKVRPDTRARVENKILELNFVPSAAARAVNSGRSKILGALIPTLDSDIFAQTIDAMERRLANFGLSLIVATTGDDRVIEERKAQELLNIGVEGLVLSGITHSEDLHDRIARTGVPAIAISFFDPGYHLPTIGYDNREAALSACAHLLELGHERIAFVHGPVDHNDRTRARLQGVLDLAHQFTLKCQIAELSIAGGSMATAEILAEEPLPDAILCASDVQAFGVLFELHRAGVEVPRDISVMGIHDLPGAETVAPRLSTVSLPTQEMGRKAAEALAAWVEDDRRPEPISLPTEIIVRESTRERR